MTLCVSYTEVLRAQRTSCQRCPRALVTVARNPILWPAQFLEPFRHWGALTSSFVSNRCSRHCHEHVFMPRSGSSQRSFWVSERVRLRLWGHSRGGSPATASPTAVSSAFSFLSSLTCEKYATTLPSWGCCFLALPWARSRGEPFGPVLTS